MSIQNRAVGVGLSAARAGGGRGLLRMAGALFRSGSGSFLSATGQGSAAGSLGRICTRAADCATPTALSRFQTRLPTLVRSRTEERLGEQGRGSDAIRSAAATLRVGMPLERNRPACTRPLRRPRCQLGQTSFDKLRMSGLGWQRRGFGLASPCPGPATSRKESARRVTYMVQNVKMICPQLSLQTNQAPHPKFMSATNGLVCRSWPKVLVGPWPGTKVTSSPSGHSFWVIESSNCW